MENEKGSVCANGSQCDEIKRITTLWPELEKWKKSIEEKVHSQGEAIKEVLEFQGGTKVYVAEIKQQLTNLETRLFTFMGDLVKNLTAKDAKEAETASKERSQSMDKWLSFAKYVITATIAAVIGYLLKKGGN